jgi:hypothetical protein
MALSILTFGDILYLADVRFLERSVAVEKGFGLLE